MNTGLFSSYCVNLFEDLTPTSVFPTSGDPTSINLNATGNAGRIGYLYQQYGSILSAIGSNLSNAQAFQQQALQLAIWKLEYDSGTDLDSFNTGNLKNLALDTTYSKYITNDTLPDLTSLALGYIQESAGHSEQAVVLQVRTDSTQTTGYQDVLASGSLNFSNLPKASPSIATVASATANSVVGSASTYDTATLSGGYSPTGTVAFTLYNSANVAVFTDTEAAGATVTSASYTPTAVDTYKWSATYGGDTNNNSASDNGNNESVSIVQASPSIATVASATANSVVGSASTYDTATLSGGYSPTGTVAFTLYNSANVAVFTDTEAAGATVTSASYTPTAVDTYKWSATYGGDTNNNSATDHGTNESVSIVQASPSIATVASATANSVVGSASTYDTATLSGGYSPTGTVAFTLYNSANVAVFTDTEAAGATVTSASYTPTAVDTYKWSATYGGDTNNNSASDNGNNESVSIVQASPSIATVASATANSVVGSASTYDTATLSGGYSPTGTVAFTLYNSANVAVFTDTEAAGATVTSASYTPTAVDTYHWSATYGGDANNNSASDNGNNESVSIVQASPSIVTKPGVSVITCQSQSGDSSGCGSQSTDSFCGPQSGSWSGWGSDSTGSYCGQNSGSWSGWGSYSTSPSTVLTDSATLSGAYQATGTITFKLYLGTKLLDTEIVSVHGNGTYSTPNGYKLPSNAAAGVYQWDSYYSGDSKHSAVADVNNCNEQVVITNSGNSDGWGCGSQNTSNDCGETGNGSFWCGSKGQSLIKCFNGGSTQEEPRKLAGLHLPEPVRQLEGLYEFAGRFLPPVLLELLQQAG